MKWKIASVVGVVAIVFVVYFFGFNNENKQSVTLEKEEVKALVHDYSVGNRNNEVASITGTELIVTDSDNEQTIYTLPKDEFFVSIAPYIDQTHP